MSRKRKPNNTRPWQPMVPAVKIPPTPERIEATRAYAVEMGFDPDEVLALLMRDAEMWKNDRYTVVVERDDEGTIHSLSVRRNDRKPDIPWRHLQRIKNEIAGPEVEAIELFPAESRLVDSANQRWLWCAAPGVVLEVGFPTRVVTGPEEAERLGARQTPFDGHEATDAPSETIPS